MTITEPVQYFKYSCSLNTRNLCKHFIYLRVINNIIINNNNNNNFLPCKNVNIKPPDVKILRPNVTIYVPLYVNCWQRKIIFNVIAHLCIKSKSMWRFQDQFKQKSSIRIESAAALCSSSPWMGGMKEKMSNCFWKFTHFTQTALIRNSTKEELHRSQTNRNAWRIFWNPWTKNRFTALFMTALPFSRIGRCESRLWLNIFDYH